MGRWCFPEPILYGDDEYINEWVKRWNRLRNDGKSKSEKALEVFLTGIEALESKEGVEAPRNPRKEKVKEIKARREREAELAEIRLELGEEEFAVWCQENNEDASAPYKVDLRLDYRVWLDRLLRNGQPCQVADIHAQADTDGFDATEWHRIECYAARKGYKKMYGVWQRKL